MTAGLSNCSYCKFLDKLPYGLDEGAAKLMLYYQASALVMNSDASEASLQRFSNLAQKVGSYEERSQSLRGGFSNAVKRYAGKGLAFTSENSVIFGAAAVGAAAGGPAGGIAATTSATFPQVLGASFVKEMEKGGYDIQSSDQVHEAFADKDFMKQARRASYIHAGQMSSAVLLAGTLAGYLYSAFAKPVASVGTSMARTVLPRIVGEVTEKSAGMVGDVLAKGFKSAVNAVGKKAVQRVPMRAFLLAAAVPQVDAEGGLHTPHVVQPQPAHVVSAPRFPSYNTSTLYI
jgi:hypothetical protein